MNWSALIGGLIGAGIPAWLAYAGLRRGSHPPEAESFGPAVVLLDRVHPARVTMTVNADPAAEAARWADLQQQLDVARERLLVVSAGNPRRHVRKLARAAEVKLTIAFQASHRAAADLPATREQAQALSLARQRHAEAQTAMRDLIAADFGWSLSWHLTRLLALIPFARARPDEALQRPSAVPGRAIDAMTAAARSGAGAAGEAVAGSREWLAGALRAAAGGPADRGQDIGGSGGHQGEDDRDGHLAMRRIAQQQRTRRAARHTRR